ncbi:DUF3592 domain-containing protein [Flavobacterium sp. MAH-1]|uniref:DUF3592 domain-containing protein n=1 Tax=Flavobacterium agri TaxID=2743471 RepID=A0A7Y8Y473_9FLAO|nr:DUF3592 domain-containing protein [Flavobacterium agri]NUY82001.1 DUF3592 domain-containing protein [Flavobacterium agri]NYA72025.1 DUF3592 domain-containing protein [Flavobacterium agri]
MRNVPITVLLKRVQSRPLAAMGLIFTVVSLALCPVLFIVVSTFKSDIEKYDSDAIRLKGTQTTAIIRDIKPMTNVSVNGEHPTIFTYEFTADGKTVTDRFQTFDDNRTRIRMGDVVPVKHYNGQSIMTELESFAFPMYLFLLFPLPFLVIGSIFLFIDFLPVWREYQLYKTGKVVEGTVVSLMANSGMPVSGRGQSVSVHYMYTDAGGHKNFSESKTTDFAILHEKKNGDPIKLFVSQDFTKSTIVPRIENQKHRWGIQW